jgi:hypothetical protein
MSTKIQAKILSLQIHKDKRQPMEKSTSLNLIKSFGIEGDIYGTNKSSRQNNQILLMDKETLDDLNLTPGIIKENITTKNIAINSLKIGQKLSIGQNVILQITKPCAPCSLMDKIRPGLHQLLENQRGMLAKVEQSGIIKENDSIELIN